MAYTLAEAARAVRRDKTTLFKAIRKGTISATRDAMTGAWTIEPAELHRVYPVVEPGADTGRRWRCRAAGDSALQVEIRELGRRLAKDALIADLSAGWTTERPAQAGDRTPAGAGADNGADGSAHGDAGTNRAYAAIVVALATVSRTAAQRNQPVP